ncbi:MAG: succinylglutamate desuccinylase/aspartoacylase family protein [Deltaproteobacteria bacterium]|nr:succinylglutamate desuccinylase/aspartoacylase family protein [Deltaproteobacteria bacterium]
MKKYVLMLVCLFCCSDLVAATPIENWCTKVKEITQELKWDLLMDPCLSVQWKSLGSSNLNMPLVYAEFGNTSSQNTTLVFSMVHGDEITPFYLGLKLAFWLHENESKFKTEKIVIAPLVNPDGFFARPRTRVNAKGVDINRNFPTRDWDARAIKLWKSKYASDKRRYPGATSHSEPETLFQEELIRLVRPQKILSIHAPLNFLDYDGPSHLYLSQFPKDYVKECVKLRSRLKAVSGGFFPGSLGNYTGQERGIPTLTLELPSADPARAERYWQKFKQGLDVMIHFKMPDYAWNKSKEGKLFR